jgi:hypothetical protein
MIMESFLKFIIIIIIILTILFINKRQYDIFSLKILIIYIVHYFLIYVMSFNIQLDLYDKFNIKTIKLN